MMYLSLQRQLSQVTAQTILHYFVMPHFYIGADGEAKQGHAYVNSALASRAVFRARVKEM